MTSTVASRSGRDHYRFPQAVEASKASVEFTDDLIAVSRLAPKGKRDPRVTQLAKDMQLGHNVAGKTTINLLFGAQDAGVSADMLAIPLRRLIGWLKAREGKSRPVSFDDLHVAETELQGVFDAHQVYRLKGDKSPARRREMLSVLPRVIDQYKHMQEALEIEEYEQSVSNHSLTA